MIDLGVVFYLNKNQTTLAGQQEIKMNNFTK